MGEILDHVARALAHGTSRKEFLRLAATAAVASLGLGSAPRAAASGTSAPASPASAAAVRCTSFLDCESKDCCRGRCCPEFNDACTNKGTRRESCCPLDSICGQSPNQVCCFPDEECINDTGECCPELNACISGKACCDQKKGQECCADRCCATKKGETCCQDLECCSKGEVCTETDFCCPAARACGPNRTTFCCPDGESCDPTSLTCTPCKIGQKCKFGPDGAAACGHPTRCRCVSQEGKKGFFCERNPSAG